MFTIDIDEYKEYFEYIETRYNFKIDDISKNIISNFESDEEIDLEKYLQVIQQGIEYITEFNKNIFKNISNIISIEYKLIDFMIDIYSLKITISNDIIIIKNYKIISSKYNYENLSLLLKNEKIKNDIMNKKQTNCKV